MLGATVGGGVLGWAGGQVGFMTGFFSSILGMGIGIYVAHRIHRNYFG